MKMAKTKKDPHWPDVTKIHANIGRERKIAILGPNSSIMDLHVTQFGDCYDL